MQRRKSRREFKLEAVQLIKELGGSVVQASRELDVVESVLPSMAPGRRTDPRQTFPGNGQFKSGHLEISKLRREVAKLKAERDISKERQSAKYC